MLLVKHSTKAELNVESRFELELYSNRAFTQTFAENVALQLQKKSIILQISKVVFEAFW